METMNDKAFAKHYTDATIVRLIAALVFIIALVAMVADNLLLMLMLTTDFAVRAFTFWPSPLAAMAKSMMTLLKIKPQPIFAAPKKFAASVGFVFALTASLLLTLNFQTAAYIVGGILCFFALLEAVFKICVGCYVYDWLVAPLVNKRHAKN